MTLSRRLTVAMVCAVLSASASAQDLLTAMREEIVRVKKQCLRTLDLEPTLYRPPGDGVAPAGDVMVWTES